MGLQRVRNNLANLNFYNIIEITDNEAKIWEHFCEKNQRNIQVKNAFIIEEEKVKINWEKHFTQKAWRAKQTLNYSVQFKNSVVSDSLRSHGL